MRAEALLRIERGFEDPPRPRDSATVEGLRGAAVVLMVAAFEAFLRDLFAERVGSLQHDRPHRKFDSLPEKLRWHAVHNVLEAAMKGTPSKPLLKQAHQIGEIQRAAEHVVRRELVGSAFAETFGRSGPDTVKDLFNQVERADIFGSTRSRFEANWGTSEVATFARDFLRAIVDVRNDVAHGSSTPTWSRSDYWRAKKFLRALGKTLDDDLRIHLNRV